MVVQGDYNGDIIISAFRRIPPHALYNDRKFVEYVTAHCLKRLGRIMGAMDFQYPGNVKLNIDLIVDDAKERIEEIEKTIKEQSNGSDLILTAY